MRILIATDAWKPQVNGVVRTYERLAREVEGFGATLQFISPTDFRSVPCPTYPQIRLAIPDSARVARLIDELRPDAVHIATEGPVGWMARSYCLRRRRPFTTSFHTRFAEYVSRRWLFPESWSYAILRRFHSRSSGVMAATESLRQDLSQRGFKRLVPWTRGVDTDQFMPRTDRLFGKEPVFLYVGRVAVEKNLEAFLSLDLPGRKVVVGDGPHLEALKRQFPDAQFCGERSGQDLARCYSSADVFVFPSRTDTFGMVLLEAMASGLPVAAFPVTGPRDIVVNGISGVLSEDLGQAARNALLLTAEDARARACEFNWEQAAALFLTHVRSALGVTRPLESRSLRRRLRPARPGLL